MSRHNTPWSGKWVGRVDGKGGYANQLRASTRKAVRRSAKREEDRRLGADRVAYRHAQFLEVESALAAVQEANRRVLRALEERRQQSRYS